MATTQQEAIEISVQVRRGLEKLYGKRLKGVYLYGSAARRQLTADSDIDIAVVLDSIPDRFAEHERTSQLGSDVSLEYNTLVSLLFVSEGDYRKGRFAVHRAIKEEGIVV